MSRRLVVVAPHPDDEVLAAGGLMRRRAGRGWEVLIIAVTDGEASHAESAVITADQLRSRRADERDEALDRLVITAEVVRLGAPDGGCDDHVESIAASTATLLRPTDAIVGPSIEDRHPDHVAVAAAVRRAARGITSTVWEAPTWALVHGTAPSPSCVLRLDDDDWCAKRHAMAAYRSQLEALGADPLDGPVVHGHELALMLRRREQFRAVEVGP